MVQSPSWEADSCSASKKIIAFYGAGKFVALFSKKSATGPYLEPDESTLAQTLLSYCGMYTRC
jgi:hypothetical protein